MHETILRATTLRQFALDLKNKNTQAHGHTVADFLWVIADIVEEYNITDLTTLKSLIPQDYITVNTDFDFEATPYDNTDSVLEKIQDFAKELKNPEHIIALQHYLNGLTPNEKNMDDEWPMVIPNDLGHDEDDLSDEEPSLIEQNEPGDTVETALNYAYGLLQKMNMHTISRLPITDEMGAAYHEALLLLRDRITKKNRKN